jgi:drug/metabolite transporter, DME family
VAVGLAYVLLREVPTTRTWIATVVAVAGVGLMVGGPGRGSLSGVIASVIMSVLFVITIVIARHQRSISMLPALVMGQVMLFSIVVWFADFASVTWDDIVVFGVMGAFQMGFSQLCFTTGARHLPASEVGLWTLLEVVLGPLWVWLFASETPARSTLIGGAIVVAAVVYQATERSAVPVIVAAEAVVQ